VRGGGYGRFEVRFGDMWFVWMMMHEGVGKMRPFSFLPMFCLPGAFEFMRGNINVKAALGEYLSVYLLEGLPPAPDQGRKSWLGSSRIYRH
jgi:hypothetical protein